MFQATGDSFVTFAELGGTDECSEVSGIGGRNGLRNKSETADGDFICHRRVSVVRGKIDADLELCR